MRVRVENDGKPGHMTRITNADTGEDLSGLRVYEVVIGVKDDAPKVDLFCYFPAFDVIGEAGIHQVCPHCGYSVEKQVKHEKTDIYALNGSKEPVGSVWDI